jgi:hypothetical protein
MVPPMKTRLRVCGPVVAFAALSGCEVTLPVAPTDLTTGIIIYEHANFLGRSAHVTEDIKDLRSVDRGACALEDSTTWNDCVSSVRVAPGTRVTLYRDPNFRGESLELTIDIPNLQLAKGSCSHEGLNDCVTAIRIENP